MDVFKAIEERRSIKHFDANYNISAEDEKKLFEAAALSPTAFNIQNWRFVVVKDKTIREKIKSAAWGQAQVTDASLLIIMTADIKAWEKNPERYWNTAPADVQKSLVGMIHNYYTGKDQVQRDEAMRSCGIAAQTLMLAAKGMGLDSCPMDGFDFDKVAEIINLPKDHVITMFVVIGKAVTPARPKGGQLDLQEIIIENSFK